MTVQNTIETLNTRTPDWVTIGRGTIYASKRVGNTSPPRGTRHAATAAVPITYAVMLTGIIGIGIAALTAVLHGPVVWMRPIQATVQSASLPVLLTVTAASLALHEAGHYVTARAAGIPIEEIGIVLIGAVPAGLYVKPDDDAWDASTPTAKRRMLSGGVATNVLLAAAAAVVVTASPAGGLVMDSMLNTVFAPSEQVWVTGAAVAVIVNVVLAVANAVPLTGHDGGHLLRTRHTDASRGRGVFGAPDVRASVLLVGLLITAGIGSVAAAIAGIAVYGAAVSLV